MANLEFAVLTENFNIHTSVTTTNSYDKVLIHIGLPKAASTTLQRNLLCNSDLGFVPVNGSNKDAAMVDPMEHFVHRNALTFSADESRAHFRQLIEANVPDGKIPVVSQEQLAGNPDKGAYWGKDVADRLKQVFPEAAILLVVREQCSYALSCYNQRIRSGSNMSLERFIGVGDTTIPGYPPVLDPDFLEYHHLVSYYQKLFGAERVVVLAFEEVVRNLSAAAARLQEALGLEPKPCEAKAWGNRGEGMATVRLKRFLNTFAGESSAFGKGRYAFTWKPLNGLARAFQALAPGSLQAAQKERYLQIIREHYGDRFSASNRQLEKLTGVDLKSLGYR